MGLYSKYVLPKLIDCGCGQKDMQRQRELVVPRARGKVVEIGLGSGHNLPFYNSDQVTEVIGLEPAVELRDMANERAQGLSFGFELLSDSAEAIPLDSETVDSVVVTFTLCTIPDVVAALDEMRRILKPDGQLLFSEHGRAPDASVSKWQDRIDPFWGVFTGGCHINRPMQELIGNAGFGFASIESDYLPGMPRIAAYQSWGVATPV